MVVTAGDLARGRHRHAAPGRRRGAHPALHPPQDRPGLRRRLHLRQGRHARPGAGRAADRPGERGRRSSRRSARCSSRTASTPPRPRRTPAAATAAPRSSAVRRDVAGAAAARPRAPRGDARPRRGLGVSSTRRCSTASTSACAASVAQARRGGRREVRKLEAVVDELKELARAGRDAGAGGLALLPGASRGRPADAARSGDAARSRPRGSFPRQDGADGLCLADYVLDRRPRGALRDHRGRTACASGWRRGSTRAST